MNNQITQLAAAAVAVGGGFAFEAVQRAADLP
jgi:hypothetical protein